MGPPPSPNSPRVHRQLSRNRCRIANTVAQPNVLVLPSATVAETLPSIIPERIRAIQHHAALYALSDLVAWRERVHTDGNVDDFRKLVEFETRMFGAEPDKKVDPNANLPVFNFVFHNGIHATIEPAPGPAATADVTDVQAKGEDDVPYLEVVQTKPPPTMDSSGLDELLGDIDQRLGL